MAFFAASLLIASLVATGRSIAEDVPSKLVKSDIQPSSEPLRRLAVALSSGREAMRAFRGSRSEPGDNKERISPSTAGIECSIDRIASYFSCYSSPAGAEEAETLFTRLVDELQDALPSDRWKGMKRTPGTASIRSHTYMDQGSNAHIDVDIVPQAGPGVTPSYIVSIFGGPISIKCRTGAHGHCHSRLSAISDKKTYRSPRVAPIIWHMPIIRHISPSRSLQN
jgi:hypothetical protein